MNEPLKRVLFVCVCNACRSQMAEAFARVYGHDALVAASAGLTPAMAVMPDTATSFPRAFATWAARASTWWST